MNRTLSLFISSRDNLRAYIRWAWAPQLTQHFILIPILHNPFSLTMQYAIAHSHSAHSFFSNRNTTRRWRASQRALRLPLSFLDPALRTLYVSAMELQAESPNIVTCNPFKKEAEETP